MPYEELEGAAEELTVAGIKVRVAGLDIIASKEYVGRPKDNKALAELYRLRYSSTDDGTRSV